MKEKTNKNKWLHIRLSEEEYDAINRFFIQSTCRKLSEYARKRLLEKPINIIYRNQSADEFITEASLLRTELNRIGNNFNQAVKRLHTLHEIPEFRTWLITYELEKKTLFNKIDAVKNHLQNLSEKWLQ